MATFDDILRTYRIERVELTSWIEQRWVRPNKSDHGYDFDEVDEARVALIRELRQDFMVSEESLGLVLSLLDQLYAARHMLRSVEDAIEALPTSVRQQVRAELRKTD